MLELTEVLVKSEQGQLRCEGKNPTWSVDLKKYGSVIAIHCKGEQTKDGDVFQLATRRVNLYI